MSIIYPKEASSPHFQSKFSKHLKVQNEFSNAQTKPYFSKQFKVY
jgi:hypothetical protein